MDRARLIHSLEHAGRYLDRSYWTGLIGEERAVENALADYFRFLGYVVELSRGSPDGSCDLSCLKNREKIVIDANAYSAPVGLEHLAPIRQARTRNSATKAMLIGLGGFTRQCLDEASDAKAPVELWGIDDLVGRAKRRTVDLISEFESEIRSASKRELHDEQVEIEQLEERAKAILVEAHSAEKSAEITERLIQKRSNKLDRDEKSAGYQRKVAWSIPLGLTVLLCAGGLMAIDQLANDRARLLAASAEQQQKDNVEKAVELEARERQIESERLELKNQRELLETELNSRTYTLESDLEKERIAIRAREEKVRKWESRHAAEESRHIPRLRRGMDFNQVDALLGRPEMFFNHANVDEWIYGCLADGKYSVWFYSGVLDGATRTDDCEGPPSGEIKPIEYFVTELLDKLDGVKE